MKKTEMSEKDIEYFQKMKEHISRKNNTELASDIDYVLKEYFGKNNVEFLRFYHKELDKLRVRDSLIVKIKKLNKAKTDIEKYQEENEKVEFLNKEQENIRLLYLNWKERKKVQHDVKNIDVENFFYQECNSIQKIVGAENYYLHIIKKILQGKEKAVPMEVDKKTIDNYNIAKKIEFELEKTDKEDYVLLAELGKHALEKLIYIILASWENKNVILIKANLPLMITHFCASNTKGKEKGRHNASKTKGKDVVALQKEYLQLVRDVKAILN